MKKLLLILLILSEISCLAQSLKAVTLVPQRTYYLNGGLRASSGGISRETIKIELPPNTKSWYYSFSTAPGADGTELLNLGIQLSAKIYGGPVVASLASSIKVPKGSGSADVFILTPTSRDAFLRKEDNNWKYYKDISVQNTLQAVQYIGENYGSTFYIGLRNPSTLTGIAIYIEVVALVEEADPNFEKGVAYGNLGWNAFERGEFSKCIELSEKALTYDPNLHYVKFNIALVHLIQGHEDCLDHYIDTISTIEKDRNPKTTLLGALQDIQNIKFKYFNVKYISDVEALLANELLKY